jgi:5-methylcytosine-specific restriction endonuclease McrA
MQRDPVELDGRAMSTARRQRIIARDGNCCRYPECEVMTGLEVDHIVALKLGGRDTDDNLETLCRDHHLAKTKRDVALIAKAKRLNLAHTGQKPPATQKIRSRGFQRRWGDLAHD